jgi:hypothetical protein
MNIMSKPDLLFVRIPRLSMLCIVRVYMQIPPETPRGLRMKLLWTAGSIF